MIQTYYDKTETKFNLILFAVLGAIATYGMVRGGFDFNGFFYIMLDAFIVFTMYKDYITQKMYPLNNNTIYKL